MITSLQVRTRVLSPTTGMGQQTAICEIVSPFTIVPRRLGGEEETRGGRTRETPVLRGAEEKVMLKGWIPRVTRCLLDYV
jgi:hypothetical protein